MTLTIAELALALLIMTAGATIQGSVGFGQNMIAAPLLLLIDSTLVPGPIIIAAVAINVLLYVRDFDSVDHREMAPALVSRIPGSILGALVVSAVSATVLQGLVAGFVFFGVAVSVAGWKAKLNVPTFAAAGFASGFTGTSASIGGAPLGIVLQHQQGPKIRGSMGVNFCVGSVLAIASLVVVGVIDRSSAVTGLAIMPGVLAGFVLSRFLLPTFDRGWARPAVLILCTLSALALTVRTIWG